MIVVIDGKRLDTDKARTWILDYSDEHANWHRGELYLSSGGTWYVRTPSQWASGQRWELCDPTTVLERYGRGLQRIS